MEEEDEEEDALAALCDEFQADGLAGAGEDSESDYEEVEDFDPEYSVFGSEKAVEPSVSILGKRYRDHDYETVEADEEMTQYTTFSSPSKAFIGAASGISDGTQATAKPTILRPIMRR